MRTGEVVRMASSAAAAAVLLGGIATPATAHPGEAGRGRPEVHRNTCSSMGGTFSVVRGLRTCTTVRTDRSAGPVVTAAESLGGGRWFLVTRYGESRRTQVTVTTTRLSQHGNGDVETSTRQEVASTLEPVSCYTRVVLYTPNFEAVLDEQLQPPPTELPFEVCADADLFVA